MNIRIKLFFMIIALLFTMSSLTSSAKGDLLSLSLKELMNVNIGSPYSGKIFQSEVTPITADSYNFALMIPVGTVPQYSAEIIAAADLAASKVNEMGGINGKKLAIVGADDGALSDISVTLANRLIQEYRISAIIGAGNSDVAEELLKQVSIPNKVPLLTHSASSNRLAEISGGKYFWRMLTSNQGQVKIIADELEQLNRLDRVYLIKDRTLYSKEMTKGIKEELTYRGNSIVGELTISELVDIATMNLRSEVNSMIKAKPHAVFVTLKSEKLPQFMQAIDKLWHGSKPLFIMGDTVKPVSFKGFDIEHLSPCIKFLISQESSSTSAPLQEHINALLKINNSGFDSAYIYDSIFLMAMAKSLEKSKNIPINEALKRLTNGSKLITENHYPDIESMFNKNASFRYRGMSGQIQFDHQGQNIHAKMLIRKLKQTTSSQNKCLQAL
ncbi:ABC transporter substrate-binding protein [Aliikangiella sp. G2MR2-5]|uniref:ABC transporter substrate-binding protein n=1 Tax=Aliikangiella sp. G2MR2-5 TaxID=2788943 RepID=UPI001AEE0006|nr:ABC transporter substrate-binding protein [Aliikangiella sp. G2MR2-5]